jgi:hypothetical protein
MWRAYKQWCADRGRRHVSHARFGRLARWPKQKVGGVVWYFDCALVEEYAGLAPMPGPKALSGPGTIAKGSTATH